MADEDNLTARDTAETEVMEAEAPVFEDTNVVPMCDYEIQAEAIATIKRAMNDYVDKAELLMGDILNRLDALEKGRIGEDGEPIGLGARIAKIETHLRL